MPPLLTPPARLDLPGLPGLTRRAGERRSRRPSSSSAFTAALLALGTALGTGCRHRAAAAPPTPAPATEEYCWWTLLRTSLPPDSVAARFQRGYAAAGLTGAAWTSRADTAWARAGPTPLAGSPGPSYASRAVAFRQGDSTSFRYFVTVAPPASRAGRAPAADSGTRWMNHMGLCGTVARAAGVLWSTPRRPPNAEDSLAVWARVP